MKNVKAISRAAANSYHDSKVLGKTEALGSAPCSVQSNLLCVYSCPYASSSAKGYREITYPRLQHVHEHHPQTLQ